MPELLKRVWLSGRFPMWLIRRILLGRPCGYCGDTWYIWQSCDCQKGTAKKCGWCGDRHQQEDCQLTPESMLGHCDSKGNRVKSGLVCSDCNRDVEEAVVTAPKDLLCNECYDARFALVSK